VLLLVSGCVVPTTGGATIEPTLAQRFRVEIDPPGRVRATTEGGVLESVGTGTAAVLTGWVPRSDATLVVVTDVPVRLLSQRRLPRPDAAVAVGGQDLALGFRLLVDAASGSVERACVLARLPDGAVALLTRSDPGLCPSPGAAG
jgi:hypothetical protein